MLEEIAESMRQYGLVPDWALERDKHWPAWLDFCLQTLLRQALQRDGRQAGNSGDLEAYAARQVSPGEHDKPARAALLAGIATRAYAGRMGTEPRFDGAAPLGLADRLLLKAFQLELERTGSAADPAFDGRSWIGHTSDWHGLPDQSAMPVLLVKGNEGRIAELSLHRYPGPDVEPDMPLFVPAPASFLLKLNEDFQHQLCLAEALLLQRLNKTRAQLPWRIVWDLAPRTPMQPLLVLGGPSVGAAFAVGALYLARHDLSRALRESLETIDFRRALVTAALPETAGVPGSECRLESVGRLPAKLNALANHRAAHPHLRALFVSDRQVGPSDQPADVAWHPAGTVDHLLVRLALSVPRRTEPDDALPGEPASALRWSATALQPEDETRRSYLNRLVERHRWLLLVAIRAANAVRRVELERVYVALKADPDSNYERRYARAVHDLDVMDLASDQVQGELSPELRSSLDAWVQLRSYRPERSRQKKAAVKEARTLADVFSQHRWAVVLGAPGSGKSTLASWLTLQLAKGMLKTTAREAARVVVPAGMVDPDAEDAEQPVDLGPARLPILVRVSDYARAFAARRQETKRALPLIEFLGSHMATSDASASGSLDLDSATVNKLVRAHLGAGQAVVILDGLDELVEADRRPLADQIEDFIRFWINGRGIEPVPSSAMPPSQPGLHGGNQILITSRFAGYHIAPIEEGTAHFDVQPMTRPAVERFCAAWSGAVGADPWSAGGLINEIFESGRPALEELATNPLLVTILATVYHSNDRRLPDLRAELYDRAIDNLLNMWLDREECRAIGMEKQLLLSALEPIAAHMHESSTNGLVHIDQIGDLIAEPFAEGHRAHDPQLEQRRVAFLSTLRDQVGLLAEQSDRNYAFLHRTFQEFLAGRHLIRKRARAAARIVEKLDAPTWREPILLALGFATYDASWTSQEQSALLRDVLNAADPVGHVIPRSALMLCFALQEMRRTPPEIVGSIIVRLLADYARRRFNPVYAPVLAQIGKAIASTRNTSNSDVVAAVLVRAIRGQEDEDNAYGLAAAEILRRIDWFTTDAVEALLTAVGRDQHAWDWPVDQALRAALCTRPDQATWLGTAPTLQLDRILAHLPMRRTLAYDPGLLEFAQGDWDWNCLLAALYGGYGDCRLAPLLEQQQTDRVSAARGETTTSRVTEAQNEGIQTLLAGARSAAAVVKLGLQPQDIYREPVDPAMARHILAALRGRRPAKQLVPLFAERCSAATDPVARAEAVLAVLVLDAPLPIPVSDALQLPLREALRRMGSSIRDAVLRTGREAMRTIPPQIPELRKQSLYAAVLELNAINGGSPIDVSSRIAEKNDLVCGVPGFAAYQETEYWVALLSGVISDDTLYNVSVVLDTTGRSVIFTEPFARLSESRNARAARRLEWPASPLQSRNRSPDAVLQRFIDAVAALPDRFRMLGEFAIERASDTSRADHLAEFAKYRPECLALALARRWGLDEQGYARLWLTPEARNLLWAADLFADSISQGMEDPYLRFRALWRLEPILGLATGGTYHEALKLSCEAIEDPHDYVKANELLITRLGLADLEGRFDTLTVRALRIENPDDRARALGRLALLAPAPDRLRLLEYALTSAALIVEPEARAECLSDLRPHVLNEASLLSRFEHLAGTLGDAGLVASACGDNASLIGLHRQALTSMGTAWAPLRLGFLAASADAPAARLTDRLVRWTAADEAGNDGDVAGTPLDVHTAQALERAVDSGEAGSAERLRLALARAQGIDRAAWSIAVAWRDSGPAAVRPLAALALAESGQLAAENLAHLPALTGHADDLVRFRAMLALNGRYVSSGTFKRRFSPRRSGIDIIDFLASIACQDTYVPPPVRTCRVWLAHDILHDSVPALDRWLGMAATEGPEGAPARWLVSTIEAATPDVCAHLLTRLPGLEASVSMAVLEALCRLTHLRVLRPTGEQLAVLRQAIQQIPAPTRRDLSVFIDDVKGVLEVVTTVAPPRGSQGDGGDNLLSFDQALNERLQWLNDTVASTDVTLLGRLAAIGRDMYGTEDQIAKLSTTTAQTFHRHDAMPWLFRWTHHHLQRDPSSRVAGLLLRASAAIAEAAPDLFAAEAEPKLWEPLLVELAEGASSWQTRQCALILLGRLRISSVALLRSLHAAMRDVYMLPAEAQRTVTRVRFFDADLLPPLLRGLSDESATFAKATVQLLTKLALAEGTSAVVRRRILAALADAAADPANRRPVLALAGNEKSIQLEEWLNTTLVGAIFEISKW